jgi:phage shock protein A
MGIQTKSMVFFTISRGKRNQIHQQRRYFTFTSSWHKNCNMSYVRSNYTTNEKEHNMSNVFKRMGDIMTANISSALDKWEDPQKMINLMISDLEETMDKARASLAGHKSEKAMLSRQKIEFAAAATRWEERAKMAVSQKRDDLAREALVEKRSATQQMERAEQHITALDEILAKEEAQVAEIHDKLEEVKNKQTTLVERAMSAKEKKETEEVLKKSASNDIMRHFNELEAKIERMEAEADMTRYTGKSASTEDAFSKMEHDNAIEAELKTLKEKNDAAKK